VVMWSSPGQRNISTSSYSLVRRAGPDEGTKDLLSRALGHEPVRGYSYT
jgi:hypothetical protein